MFLFCFYYYLDICIYLLKYTLYVYRITYCETIVFYMETYKCIDMYKNLLFLQFQCVISFSILLFNNSIFSVALVHEIKFELNNRSNCFKKKIFHPFNFSSGLSRALA